jgi:hypothetical protein
MEDMLAPQGAEDEFKAGIASNTPGAAATTGGRPPKPTGIGYGYGWVWSDMTQKWIPRSPPPPTGDAPSAGTTQAVGTPEQVKALGNTFVGLTPEANPGIKSVTDQAQGVGAAASPIIDTATGMLLEPGVTPTVADPRDVKAPKAPVPVVANTSASGASFDGAVGAMAGFAAPKQEQLSYLEQLKLQASGKGPSVAGDMIRASGAENAATTEKAVADANAQYGEHSREAIDAYGSAADQAALDYANAFGDQQAAFEAAAMNASQATRQAAEDAIRMSASLTSSARGGNIGAALLNAQDNAAMTSQQANQQIANQRAQYQREAAAQAAGAGRQTAYGQAVSNSTTGKMQSTADATTATNTQQAVIASNLIKAKADIEAGRVLSEEQIAALSQLGVGIKDLQTMTNDEVMAWIAAGGLGGTIDATITNVAVGNADRNVQTNEQTIGVDKFNVEQETGVNTGNADRAVNIYGIDTQAATSVLNTQAGREAMALAAEGDMAALAAQLHMTEAELGTAIYSAAKGFGLEYDKMDRQERAAVVSGIMSGGATIGAAAIMNSGKN